MNRVLFPVLAGACLAPAAAGSVWFADSQTLWLGRVQAPALVATFSEPLWPVNQPLGGAWTLNGVTYQGFAGAPFPNIYVITPSPLTGPALTANGDEDIELRFATPPTAVGFDVAVNQFGPVTLRVFGRGGAEIGSTTIPASSARFFGVVSVQPIEKVRYTSVHGTVRDSLLDNVMLAANGCRADFNADGTLDFFDYLDFVAALDAGDFSGDFNGDGTTDFFDYLDFVAALDVGC